MTNTTTKAPLSEDLRVSMDTPQPQLSPTPSATSSMFKTPNSNTDSFRSNIDSSNSSLDLIDTEDDPWTISSLISKRTLLIYRMIMVGVLLALLVFAISAKTLVSMRVHQDLKEGIWLALFKNLFFLTFLTPLLTIAYLIIVIGRSKMENDRNKKSSKIPESSKAIRIFYAISLSFNVFVTASYWIVILPSTKLHKGSAALSLWWQTLADYLIHSLPLVLVFIEASLHKGKPKWTDMPLVLTTILIYIFWTWMGAWLSKIIFGMKRAWFPYQLLRIFDFKIDEKKKGIIEPVLWHAGFMTGLIIVFCVVQCMHSFFKKGSSLKREVTDNKV